MKLFKQSVMLFVCLTLCQSWCQPCLAMEYFKSLLGSRYCVQPSTRRESIEQVLYKRASELLAKTNEYKEAHPTERDGSEKLVVGEDGYTMSTIDFKQGDTRRAVSADIEAKENPLQRMAVYDAAYKNELKGIMYELLDPMPMDLINIVLSYLPFVSLQGKLVKQWDGHRYTLPRVLSNGLLAVIDAGSHAVCLIDPSTGMCVATFAQEKTETVFTDMVALSKNKLVIASHPRDDYTKGTINCLNCSTGKKEWEVGSDRLYVPLVKLSKQAFAALYCKVGERDPRLHVSGTMHHYKHIDIVHAHDGTIAKTITSPHRIFACARLSSQQKLLAASMCLPDQTHTEEGAIRIYNWETGQVIRSFGGADYTSLISLNNRLLVSTGSLTTEHLGIALLCVWDCNNGKLLKFLTPLNARNEITRAYVFQAARMPNNQMVCFGGCCMTLVDSRTGECKENLPNVRSEIRKSNVAILADGRLALIDSTPTFDFLSGEGRLQIWR